MSRPTTIRREWLLDFLAKNPNSDAEAIAAAIFSSRRNTQHLLTDMHGKQVFISAWKKQSGEGCKGRPIIRLWSVGEQQVDAPKPARDTPSEIQKRRKTRLQEKLGQDWSKAMRPRSRKGSSVIYREGELVYRRGNARTARESA